MNKISKKILTGLISAGIIGGVIILVNKPADSPKSLTVQEWRMLVEIYDKEAQGGIKLENIKTRADVLDKLDKKILDKIKSRNNDYDNLAEKLIFKRNGERSIKHKFIFKRTTTNNR